MYRITYKIRCEKCDSGLDLYEVYGPFGLQYFCRNCLKYHDNKMEIVNPDFIDMEVKDESCKITKFTDRINRVKD